MVNFSIRHTKIRLYIGIVLLVVYFDRFEHIRGGLRNFLHIQWNDCWLLSVVFILICPCLYCLCWVTLVYVYFIDLPLFMLIGPCLCCLLCWFALVCVCIFCWFALVCVCWIALSCVVYMLIFPCLCWFILLIFTCLCCLCWFPLVCVGLFC